MTPIRTFPARTSGGNILLIVMLAAAAIGFMWTGSGLLIAFTLIMLLLVIERTIHTEYRIADNVLMVHRGRFARDQVIDTSVIRRVERIRRLRIGRHSLYSYLLVVTTDGREVAISPRNEADFIDCLMKIKAHDTES